MIWDCFIYNGESQLLKIRLEELKRLEPLKKLKPITHVIIESTHTFTGLPKEPTFKAGDWMDYPIEYFVFNETPHPDPWVNETAQRNYIKTALQILNAGDEDTVIISDLDEIPRAYALQHYHNGLGLVAFQMDMYYYYLNTIAERSVWNLARIMPWSYLNSEDQDGKARTPDGVRRGGFNLALVLAGWHYSWQGGVDMMLKKLKSFSHQDPGVQRLADRDFLQGKLDRIESPWAGNQFQVLPFEEMPLYVQMHMDEFKGMIKC